MLATDLLLRYASASDTAVADVLSAAAKASVAVKTNAFEGIYRLKSAKLCTRMAAILPIHPR